MKLVLLGAPGAGKGTQAKILSKAYQIPTISTGNILRAAIHDGTPVGLRVKEAIDAGCLVPDELVMNILEERLAVFIRPGLAGKRHFEDFPRAYAGLRVGLNSGFVTVDDVRYRDMVESGVIDQSYARDNRTNLLKLLHQRTDVYINDRLSILWELQRMVRDGSLSHDEASRLVEGPTLSTEHGHLGFSRLNTEAYPYRADFIQHFNTALGEVMDDGTVARLVREYSALEPELPTPGRGH